MDADHTGFITKENFSELVGIDMTPDQVDEVFAEVDRDGDGRIGYQEFVALMKGVDMPVSEDPANVPRKKTPRFRSLLRSLTNGTPKSPAADKAPSRTASMSSQKSAGRL